MNWILHDNSDDNEPSHTNSGYRHQMGLYYCSTSVTFCHSGRFMFSQEFLKGYACCAWCKLGYIITTFTFLVEQDILVFLPFCAFDSCYPLINFKEVRPNCPYLDVVLLQLHDKEAIHDLEARLWPQELRTHPISSRSALFGLNSNVTAHKKWSHCALSGYLNTVKACMKELRIKSLMADFLAN